MRFNKDQIELVAKTLADVAKLLFASSVVGFFIPGSSGTVTVGIFLTGSIFATLFFLGSIVTLKS